MTEHELALLRDASQVLEARSGSSRGDASGTRTARQADVRALLSVGFFRGVPVVRPCYPRTTARISVTAIRHTAASILSIPSCVLKHLPPPYTHLHGHACEACLVVSDRAAAVSATAPQMEARPAAPARAARGKWSESRRRSAMR